MASFGSWKPGNPGGLIGSYGGNPSSESEPDAGPELEDDAEACFFYWLALSTSRSPISSAVLPPSVFAKVDNPRPPIANFNARP